MKMKKDDYKKLKKAVFKVINDDPDILVRDVSFIKDMEESRRWQIYWLANSDYSFGYDYLKDSHIDTALRNIIAEYKTKVMFLEDEKGLIAVFTESEREGYYLCYAHVGQHFNASVEYVKSMKKAEDYKDLKKELESIGYMLEEV